PSGEEELKQRAGLLERLLFVAAHFERKELVEALLTRFRHFLRSQRGRPEAFRAFSVLAGRCLGGLRQVGMSEELLRLMADAVLEGHPVEALRERAGKNWARALCTLLHVAGGWLSLGPAARAQGVLNYARGWLFGGAPLFITDLVPLLCAYAQALG